MIFQAYAIRDSKLDAYLPPMFVRTEAQIVRFCADEVNGDGSSSWAKHPDDFALWAIGTFDDNSGMLVPVTPVFLMHLDSLVRRNDER